VPALLALMAPTFGPVTLRDVLSRAGAGDPACRRVLADAGTAIGEAAAAVYNLINPERIVVGGDLAAAGELLIAPMRDAVLRASIASAAEDVQVVAAALGDRAEVLGAVVLVLRDDAGAVAPPP
jgi:predicted NBD/HSP70 family sugar kinase